MGQSLYESRTKYIVCRQICLNTMLAMLSFMSHGPYPSHTLCICVFNPRTSCESPDLCKLHMPVMLSLIWVQSIYESRMINMSICVTNFMSIARFTQTPCLTSPLSRVTTSLRVTNYVHVYIWHELHATCQICINTICLSSSISWVTNYAWVTHHVYKSQTIRILLDLYPEPRVTDYMSHEQHTSHELCMGHTLCIWVTNYTWVTRLISRATPVTDYMSHEQYTSHELCMSHTPCMWVTHYMRVTRFISRATPVTSHRLCETRTTYKSRTMYESHTIYMSNKLFASYQIQSRATPVTSHRLYESRTTYKSRTIHIARFISSPTTHVTSHSLYESQTTYESRTISFVRFISHA